MARNRVAALQKGRAALQKGKAKKKAMITADQQRWREENPSTIPPPKANLCPDETPYNGFIGTLHAGPTAPKKKRNIVVPVATTPKKKRNIVVTVTGTETLPSKAPKKVAPTSLTRKCSNKTTAFKTFHDETSLKPSTYKSSHMKQKIICDVVDPSNQRLRKKPATIDGHVADGRHKGREETGDEIDAVGDFAQMKGYDRLGCQNKGTEAEGMQKESYGDNLEMIDYATTTNSRFKNEEDQRQSSPAPPKKKQRKIPKENLRKIPPMKKQICNHAKRETFPSNTAPNSLTTKEILTTTNSQMDISSSSLSTAASTFASTLQARGFEKGEEVDNVPGSMEGIIDADEGHEREAPKTVAGASHDDDIGQEDEQKEEDDRDAPTAFPEAAARRSSGMKCDTVPALPDAAFSNDAVPAMPDAASATIATTIL